MAKVKKVRISATILPAQREHLDKLAEELNMSFAEALVDTIQRGLNSRQKVS